MPKQRLSLAFLLVAASIPWAACGGSGGGSAPGSGPLGLPAPQILSHVNWEVPPVHALAFDAVGSRLLLAHTADHRLEVFDVSTGVPVPALSIPVGLAPVSVRLRTADEAWVVNHISDSVSIVDLETGRVRATLETKDEPCDVVFAGTPERAYVTCSQVNIVQVFDPGNLAAAPIDIPIRGEDPRALAVSPDGSKVYAAVFESGNASTILGGGIAEGGLVNTMGFFPPNVVNEPTSPHLGLNPPANVGAATLPLPNPALPPAPAVGMIVKRTAAGLWMDDNGGDWSGFVTGAAAPLSGRPVGWTLPDRDLAEIDTATLAVRYARGLMNLCMDVAVNPVSGDIVVVGTDATNEVRFEPVLNGVFLRVQFARVRAADLSRAALSDLNAHLTYAAPTVPQAQRDRSLGDPRCACFNAAGTTAWIAGMGSNNVIRVDANGTRQGAGLPIEVGEGPAALALDEGRGQLYVWNRFGASISVIRTATGTVTDLVPLFDPTPPAIRAGRKLLYGTHETSGLGHSACASCHVDARMDRLAWDLGAPDGDMKSIPEKNCGLGGVIPCPDYHPQKGPMTTQTLQDIIGHEPHHWRGDRRGLEEFNPAFEGLLGDDTQLTTEEMQAFEDMLASVAFPPNPNRAFDNTLPTDLPLPGHFATGRFVASGTPLPNGNAVRGLQLYRTGGLDGTVPGLRLDCVTCHTLPTGLGTDYVLSIDLLNVANSSYGPDPIAAGPSGERHLALVAVDGSTNVTMKVPQLRNMHEKVGFECTQLESDAGFGFLHDGSIDSLARFVSEPLFGPQSVQDVADLVAFMLAFSGGDLPQGRTQGFSEPPGPPGLDTHAAVGKQATYAGGPVPPRLSAMLALADDGKVDVIVKGRVGEENRGWFYDRNTLTFVSDRNAEATLGVGSLQVLAAVDREQTWTVVPLGLGRRLGIDRDEDGFGDRTELDLGSDPTRQASTP